MRTTRRQFLAVTGTSAVLAIGGRLPEFWLRAAAAGESPTKGEKILVVVQLSGGNDGLNTIVPHGDESYYRARPQLAIPRDQVLKIDDFHGFHPSARGLADLLEAGQLAIVQGVGYPDPNRSHFESMDIWHSCFRKDRPRQDGWLGRYLDRAAGTAGGDVPALHVGEEEQPLALAAQRVRVPSVRSLDRFRLQLESGEADAATIQRLVGRERPAASDLLGFVQSSSAAALEAARRVEQARRQYQTDVEYPASGLGQKLRTVAQLIDAGLETRIYYLTLDGFDTHARQAEAHAALLTELSGSMAAFMDDLARHGHAERVLLLGFSEFGRRLEENASAGTDHGAAAPLLLAGQAVRPGLLGTHPSLTDLDQGDLKFHTDFRRVYALLLESWLGCPSAELLGGSYEPIAALA
ncbi:MAG: DUF1501 domain-containing protein [Pirellulaceae bacterium]|nr:DUF1501 domain-containing protein [Pirellulaceae bacterium]